MIDIISQIVIVTTGIVAIWCVSSKAPRVRKIGFVVGFLGQPAWLYTTYSQNTYGMFILSCYYTWAWLRGIYNS